MTGVASTTWLQAVPVVAVALAVVFVPGTVAALLLRCRPATALAVGPALSFTVVALGGVLASMASVAWSLPVAGLAVLAAWAVAAGLGLALRRRSPSPSPSRSRSRDEDPGPEDAALWPVLAGVGLGLLGLLAVLVPVSGSPDAFPQHPDTVYHLGTTRWMLERGDISALHALGYVSETGTGFYPAAFHGVAATVVQLTGATVVTGVTSTVVVLAGVVWPLGVVLLARRVLGRTVAVSLAAGVTSVAFSAFPFWFLGYGVLWPNLAGQALLPGMLVLLLALVSGGDRWRSGLALAAGLPGLALAHPNALIALGVFALPIVSLALAGAAWANRARPRRLAATLAALTAWFLAVVAAWAAATIVADTLRASNPGGAEMPVREGLLDVLLFAPRNAGYLWGPGVLVLTGLAVVALRHRRHLWVVAGFLGVAGLYLARVTENNYWTRLFTWPWYNNSPRLAALLVLPAALLAAASLAWAAGLLTRLPLWRERAWAAALSALLVCGGYVAVTGGNDVAVHRQLLDDFFQESPRTSWVTRAELTALEQLGAKVPEGAVVAANPYRGGSYLYLASGAHLLYPSEKAMAPGDRRLLGSRLDDAGTNPDVCAAAQRQHVEYALVGGDPVAHQASRHKWYAGVDAADESPAFERVATAGTYELYRLTGCAGR